jgi:hypothetical protein
VIVFRGFEAIHASQVQTPGLFNEDWALRINRRNMWYRRPDIPVGWRGWQWMGILQLARLKLITAAASSGPAQESL